MYANCPIYWVSCLQTEISLSTVKAEYVALSQSLCDVIPLILFWKKLTPSSLSMWRRWRLFAKCRRIISRVLPWLLCRNLPLRQNTVQWNIITFILLSRTGKLRSLTAEPLSKKRTFWLNHWQTIFSSSVGTCLAAGNFIWLPSCKGEVAGLVGAQSQGSVTMCGSGLREWKEVQISIWELKQNSKNGVLSSQVQYRFWSLSRHSNARNSLSWRHPDRPPTS